MDAEEIGSRPLSNLLELIDLMAYAGLTFETRHALGRLGADDAMIVGGSDLKLRLDILAIVEELEKVKETRDPDDPSRAFERLLKRLDVLVSE